MKGECMNGAVSVPLCMNGECMNGADENELCMNGADCPSSAPADPVVPSNTTKS